MRSRFPTTELGRYLQAKRASLNLTRKVLNKKAGLPKTFIDEVEIGANRKPTDEQLRRVAVVLQVDCEILLRLREANGRGWTNQLRWDKSIALLQNYLSDAPFHMVRRGSQIIRLRREAQYEAAFRELHDFLREVRGRPQKKIAMGGIGDGLRRRIGPDRY